MSASRETHSTLFQRALRLAGRVVQSLLGLGRRLVRFVVARAVSRSTTEGDAAERSSALRRSHRGLRFASRVREAELRAVRWFEVLLVRVRGSLSADVSAPAA